MSSRYIGTFRQDEGATSLFRGENGWGSRVRTLSSAYGGTAIAAEGSDRIQVSQIGRTLCLVDAPPPTAGISRASRESHADATAREWQEHGASLLHEEDVTASIVLCDAASDQIVLARAENGVPPIFFTETQDTLSWSNSIKALLQHGADTALDHRALDAYFALGYVPSPWTFFESIRKVPAGQYLEWNRGGWSLQRHRKPIPQSRTIHDLGTSAVELKRRLCRSLDQIIDGYSKVGVLLSSGVDSSLLVGLLHCELGAQVEAFTFDYSDYDGGYNEYDQARRLTRRYDIAHHKIKYSGEWLKANLEDAVRQYEEPFSYGNHTARLKEVADREIPLLLNGVKGSGFTSRTAAYALRIENPIAKRAAQVGSALLKHSPLSKPSRFKHALDIIQAPTTELFYELPADRVLPDSVREQLYKNSRDLREGRKAVLHLFEKEVRDSGLPRKAERMDHLTNHFSVHDHYLWWNYRWARAHGLDMEAPFLMPEVRSWMDSIEQPLWPPHKESIRKVLIRRAAATVMPDEFAYNRKIAQSAPFWIWFQGPLRPLLHEYLSPSALQEDGLFDTEFVQRELQKHIAGRGKRPYLIWTLLCFMVWKQVFLESEDYS